MTEFTSVDVRALETMILVKKIEEETESGFEHREYRLLF